MITIGFSRASEEGKYQLYVKWLKSVDPSFEYINFYGMDIPAALAELDRCSGLVLTGGVDGHHQAVKTLADCFRPTAFASDGIIEAFEWMNQEGKGFLHAVQWHPEKGDYHNALSQAIGKDFIEKACSYTKL